MIYLPLRVLAIVFAYLFVATSLGSILAWLLVDVLDIAYERILSRGVLLFAALGLVPLARIAGLNRRDLGLLPFVPRQLLLAYPLGVALLLPLMLFFLVVQFRVIDSRVDYFSLEFVKTVLVCLVSGLLVGLFEETLFRGVLFGFLRRGMGFLGSAVLVGILYAGVHFLDDETSAVQTVSWYAGYPYVLNAFAALGDPAGYWDAFVALFLLGGLFCWVRENYSLWWCIGLHASWVFAIRLFKELTIRDVFNPYQVWVSSYDNFVGLLVVVWLLFMFVVLHLYRRLHQNAGTLEAT